MSQTFTDPATGRQYAVDPATGQSRWVDQPPPPAPPADAGVSGALPPGAGPTEPVGQKPKTVSGIVGLKLFGGDCEVGDVTVAKPPRTIAVSKQS